jgi:hypothetical protein
MRTTINLPDELLARLKREAVRSRTTVTALIERALRRSLQKETARAKEAAPKLPTFGTRGLRRGINLDDTSRLLDELDAVDDPLGR